MSGPAVPAEVSSAFAILSLSCKLKAETGIKPRKLRRGRRISALVKTIKNQRYRSSSRSLIASLVDVQLSCLARRGRAEREKLFGLVERATQGNEIERSRSSFA